jgi:tripartite-type tricarboxylate transporter receptor subunit TctC
MTVSFARRALGVPFLLLGFALASAPNAARADAVADFYKGKTVRIVVGSAPGGGYDTYARFMARHFGKALPGAPSMVTQNMPGAGGLAQANFIYNRAAKDGTFIGAAQRGVFFEPIYGQFASKAQFDPFKFTWLGSLVNEVSVMVRRADAPIKTFRDAFSTEAIVGATRSDMETFVVAAQNMLGTKFKIVSGYPGSADVVLALTRGEVQILANISWAPFRARYGKELADGSLVPIAQFALTKHPELKDLPLITEFARNDEERQVLEMIYARQTVGRPFIAPPDVPADRAKALQSGFKTLTQDKGFLAEASKAKLEVNPVYAEEVIDLFKRVTGASNAIKARTKAAVSDDKAVKLAEIKTYTVKVANLGKKGVMQFEDAGGKKMRGRVSGQTKVTVGGKTASAKDIKVGQSCKASLATEGGSVVTLACN